MVEIPWVEFATEKNGTETEGVPSWGQGATGSQWELEGSKVLRGEVATFFPLNEKYIINKINFAIIAV